MCSFLLFYTSVVLTHFSAEELSGYYLPEDYKQEIIWNCRMTSLCLSYLTTSSPECVVFKCLLTWLCDIITNLDFFNSISLFSYSRNDIMSVYSQLSEQLWPGELHSEII